VIAQTFSYLLIERTTGIISHGGGGMSVTRPLKRASLRPDSTAIGAFLEREVLAGLLKNGKVEAANLLCPNKTGSQPPQAISMWTCMSSALIQAGNMLLPK
jgi:hypothetical protein